MSASLVGSEMCIRDRLPPLPPRGPARLLPLRSQQADFPLLSGPRPWAAPVSYTHLTLPTICSV
eukprot:12318009-Alexandrium_andersonii.AAC.1